MTDGDSVDVGDSHDTLADITGASFNFSRLATEKTCLLVLRDGAFWRLARHDRRDQCRILGCMLLNPLGIFGRPRCRSQLI